ncbi:MAG: hypothetical protein KBG84_07060 [Planctomycetes bacterium]|nr:hypothetical protein [Planctomycetota bacterium]
MMKFDAETIRDWVDYLMVANTPAFLFRKLAEDSRVRAIAIRHNAEQIVNELKILAESNSSEMESQAQLYALVVALLNTNDTSKFGLLREISTPRAEWFRALVDLVVGSSRSTSTILEIAGATNVTQLRVGSGVSYFTPAIEPRVNMLGGTK